MRRGGTSRIEEERVQHLQLPLLHSAGIELPVRDRVFVRTCDGVEEQRARLTVSATHDVVDALTPECRRHACLAETAHEVIAYIGVYGRDMWSAGVQVT